jgi:RNA polymerase sigma factor (sigma-70 family)
MLLEVEGYLRRRGYDDDAVQEGLIAAWKAEQKNPGQSTGYYARSARNGALTYIAGKRTTGRDARGKKSLATSIPYDSDVMLRMEHGEEESWAENIDLWNALDKLPDKDYAYVTYRFFHGMTHVEAHKAAGINYTAWSDRIRPNLERVLT